MGYGFAGMICIVYINVVYLSPRCLQNDLITHRGNGSGRENGMAFFTTWSREQKNEILKMLPGIFQGIFISGLSVNFEKELIRMCSNGPTDSHCWYSWEIID